MILVTGATGFLGAELIRQLIEKDIPVRALKRAKSEISDALVKNDLVTWFTADINDLEDLSVAFDGVTQVYHCAAFVSFNAKDKKELFKINIEGTANVVNLCAENSVRLLHVSSIAALGDAKKGELISEKNFWEYNPRSHQYAISKYEGEMEVWRGIAEGLDAVIVNPSVIIGASAGEEGSGAIFKLVRDGLKYYTNGATGVVDVEDVAKCMILLMNSDVSAERYILSADNLHYKEFFAEIAQGFEVSKPKREAKPWMLGLAWRAAKLASAFTGKAPALTKDAARSSLNLSYYSNQKITEALNIKFKPLKESILEVCKALK